MNAIEIKQDEHIKRQPAPNQLDLFLTGFKFPEICKTIIKNNRLRDTDLHHANAGFYIDEHIKSLGFPDHLAKYKTEIERELHEIIKLGCIK